MKRLFLLLLAGLFLGIFIFSSNREWMKAWVTYRYSNASKLPSDKYRFGDLYGISYLPAFKKKNFNSEDLRPHYVRNKATTNVHVYSMCDSYMAPYIKDASIFRHADAYRFTRWDYTAKQFYLNPDKKNILLLEMVERRVRYTVPDTARFYAHLQVVADASQERETNVDPSSWFSTHVFNRNIEQNLEFNLFEYPLFTWLKEAKAQLTYRLFNRTSRDVFASQTRHQLYLTSTIDSTNNNSSFNHLPTREVDSLVTTLNHIYKHYRRAGFAEVYLLIPPNPVTILEPQIGPYNRLIPRLQQHPALQMPVLDIYAKLNPLRRRPIYQVNDGHWSKEGFLAAMAQVDSALATHSTPKSPPALK